MKKIKQKIGYKTLIVNYESSHKVVDQTRRFKCFENCFI